LLVERNVAKRELQGLPILDPALDVVDASLLTQLVERRDLRGVLRDSSRLRWAGGFGSVRGSTQAKALGVLSTNRRAPFYLIRSAREPVPSVAAERWPEADIGTGGLASVDLAGAERRVVRDRCRRRLARHSPPGETGDRSAQRVG